MMKNCGNCANYDRTKKEHTDVCGTCISGRDHGETFGPTNWKPLPMTNADRIRAMSDEELAAVIMCPRENGAQIDACVGQSCMECSLMWLQQPAEVNDNA